MLGTQVDRLAIFIHLLKKTCLFHRGNLRR